MRRFCYTLLVVLALLLLSTLSSSSESAPDGGDTSDWDEFWDSDARAEDEAEPGSWIPILDPDLSPEPKTEDDAVYYSGMAKMIAAASSGGPGVMEEAASEIEAAATAGNPHAQSAFGFLYEMGMMRGRKREKALMYHYFAADGGNTQSKMALAYTYLRQEMHDRAVELYAELAEIAVNSFLISRDSPVIEPVRLHNGAEENKDALSRARVEEDEDSQILDSQAQKGNAAAMYKIGMFYYFGLRGLRRDRAKALSWLLKAVEKGEPKSMELLGKMYARGDGVQRNYTKALEWLTLASQQHSSAYNGMGYLYVKGYGVEKNYTKAKEYFEKAADDEEVSGHYNLGVMYLKGVGVKKDVKLATKYFIMASNGGLPKAYYQLAKMFHTGLGLKRNFPMATALYKLVAERGPWSSLSRWALDSYLKGDMGKAFLLYSRMAELGYEVAQSNAAWILDKYGKHSMCIGESGLCTAAERFQQAHSLWWQASEQGNEHAALMIGDAYYFGRGTERDYARAAGAYMHAKSQSSVRAMINLGYMYEHGLGLPFDLHLARRYYEQAIEIDPTSKLPVTLALMNKNSTRGIEEGINSTLLFQSQSQEKKSHPCSCF